MLALRDDTDALSQGAEKRSQQGKVMHVDEFWWQRPTERNRPAFRFHYRVRVSWELRLNFMVRGKSGFSALSILF